MIVVVPLGTHPAQFRWRGAPCKGDVRDWAVIDADRDYLISPEEMQKFLEKTWAAKQKTS